jgi:hypothetical protein
MMYTMNKIAKALMFLVYRVYQVHQGKRQTF